MKRRLSVNINFSLWNVVILLVWIHATFCIKVEAQEMMEFTVSHGLSHGFVNAIVQDSSGYIWVATLNGLNRFDGYEFKVYKKNKEVGTLLSNHIEGLSVDNNGILWVICESGLQYYDPETDSFLNPKGPTELLRWDESPIYTFYGNKLAIVRDGMIKFMEIVHHGREVEIIEHRTLAFKKEILGKVNSIYFGASENWIATNEGVYSMSENGLVDLIPRIRGNFYSIWRDEIHDQMCFVNSAGIYFYKQDRLVKFFKFSLEGSKNALKGLKVGKEYLLAIKGNLWKWNGYELEKNNPEFGRNITASFIDKQGNIWVGLDVSGLVCIQKKNRKVRNVINLGKIAIKQPLIDPKGPIWFYQKSEADEDSGGDFGKYTRWVPSAKTSKNVLRSFQAYHADIDRQGKIFAVGKDLRLREINSGTIFEALGGIKKFNSSFGVNCLHDGTFFLISQDGEHCGFYNPVTEEFLKTPSLLPYLNSEHWNISAFVKSSNNTQWNWVISQNAIIGIRPDWERGVCEVEPFDNNMMPDNLRKNPRFIFAQYDRYNPKIVWIGSWYGLFKWNIAAKKIEELKIQCGSSNAVFCLVQSVPDVLWIGEQGGLIRYDVKTGEQKIFTEADGLPAREFNRNTSVATKEGLIIMGTVNGTILFNPDEMLVYDQPQTLVFSKVMLGGKSLKIICKTTGYFLERLPHGSENIVVSLSMLDFSNMKTQHYRFRTSGKTWILNGLRNEITLAGLRPRAYTIEVQGSLNGSDWSKSEFLHFQVQSPWWVTWWAIGIMVLIVGFPLILLIRNKILLEKEKFQKEVLRIRTENETIITKAKEQVLTQIAQDVKDPLTLIIGLTEKIPMSSDADVVKAVETIKLHSHEMLNMIDQVLNLSKIKEFGSIPLYPKLIDFTYFLPDLVYSFSLRASEKLINLNYRISTPIPNLFIDENGIRAILGNLISHSIQITPEKGSVLVEVFVEDESLLILVTDSGGGISEQRGPLFLKYFNIFGGYPQERGFEIGLTYASEIAGLMGGKLSWLSSITSTGEGITFKVVFPLDVFIPPLHLSDNWTPSSDTVLAEIRESKKPQNRPLVLIVEAHQNMAVFIQALVERDYDTVIANDGQTGFNISVEWIPDLIIADNDNPGILGTDLCKRIRSDMRTSHIPVILLSGNNNNIEVRKALANGANLILTKPFDSDILKNYVDNSLLQSLQTKRYFESSWGNAKTNPGAAVPLPKGISKEKEKQFINRIEDLIQNNYHKEEFNVEKMADSLHISLSQLRRKIIALGGESAGTMLRNYRIVKAKEMLLTIPEASVSEVAFACGFSDPNYFSTAFSKEVGISPRQFRDLHLKVS